VVYEQYVLLSFFCFYTHIWLYDASNCSVFQRRTHGSPQEIKTNFAQRLQSIAPNGDFLIAIGGLLPLSMDHVRRAIKLTRGAKYNLPLYATPYSMKFMDETV
jgi:hypothetical protein